MGSSHVPAGTGIGACYQYPIVHGLPEITGETRYTFAYPITYSCQSYRGDEGVNHVFSRHRARALYFSVISGWCLTLSMFSATDFK